MPSVLPAAPGWASSQLRIQELSLRRRGIMAGPRRLCVEEGVGGFSIYLLQNTGSGTLEATLRRCRINATFHSRTKSFLLSCVIAGYY